MDGDEVRHPSAAQRGGQRPFESVPRDRRGPIHAARRSPAQDDRIQVGGCGRLAPQRRSRGPGIAEPVAIARPLGQRDQRELDRRRVDRARGRVAARRDCRAAVAEGDQGERELVHAVGADQPRDLGVGEARPQPRAQAARLGQRERLRKHRAGVPVEVAETALRIAPAGAPWHPRDDERRRVAGGRGADPHQRMADRVVPMHAVGQTRETPGRDIYLEREAPAGRARRAQQQARAVVTLHDPHDARGDVQQPRQRRETQRAMRRAVPAGQHGGGRSGDRRPGTRQLGRRQPVRIGLAGRGQRGGIVRHEVLPDEWVVDGRRPLPLRRVRGQTVVEAGGVAGSHGSSSASRICLTCVTRANPSPSRGSPPRACPLLRATAGSARPCRRRAPPPRRGRPRRRSPGGC
jgi:hypothetical protein